MDGKEDAILTKTHSTHSLLRFNLQLRFDRKIHNE